MIRLVERATTAIAATAAVLLGGTDEPAGRSGPGARMHAAVAAPAAARLRLLYNRDGAATLVVVGENGKLEIERLQLVAPPLLVDLPLAGGVVQVPPPAGHERMDSAGAVSRGGGPATDASDSIARRPAHPGRHHLRLHRNDADERDRTHIIELVELLRATYPAFPSRENAVAHGWFTPVDGRVARRFIAYIDAGTEPRIALPDDAKRVSSVPRGQAARRSAAQRSLATLRAVAKSAAGRQAHPAPAWNAYTDAARNARADAAWYARSDGQHLRLVRAVSTGGVAMQSLRS